MDCVVAPSGLYASGVKSVGKTLPDVLGNTKVCVCVCVCVCVLCMQQCACNQPFHASSDHLPVCFTDSRLD